ncbi:MAG: hypothetical protein VB104_03205 [Candidatus Limiplasma sp.]|nr:hypothetical protein [Candidatus Limiplasma sp.]
MAELFFGDTLKGITSGLAVILLLYLWGTVAYGRRVQAWGWRLVPAVIVGTALSALSATRDGFMAQGALFAPDGFVSLACAIAGVAVYLLAIAALVVRKQGFRKTAFILTAALLSAQIALVEGARILLWSGGLS